VKIISVDAVQLLDCKGRPMVEVQVATDSGHTGRGAAPTGQSVGSHEAFVLRDGDPREYHGLGVHQAVRNVTEVIGPALLGREVNDQSGIDALMIELDGTATKSNLGGNAIYSTSVAVLRAAAAVHGRTVYEHLSPQPVTALPVPSFNMVNGGRYGEVVQPFNEFIVMPYGAGSIEQATHIGLSIFDELADVLHTYLGHAPKTGRSYGYVAPSGDPRVVLDLMQQALDKAGFGDQVGFALDCASSEMYDATTDTYLLQGDRVDRHELIAFVKQLTIDFPIIFVEDLLDEDDWAGHTTAVAELDRTIVLGDDLVVTSRDRLERAYAERAVDGFILKPNQVGTISEALQAHAYAAEHGLLAIPSGRSGGVVDDIVMDLSIALHAPFQKNGAPRSGERIEKLNFLMRAAAHLDVHDLADIPGRRPRATPGAVASLSDLQTHVPGHATRPTMSGNSGHAG
jgi:enolase